MTAKKPPSVAEELAEEVVEEEVAEVTAGAEEEAAGEAIQDNKREKVLRELFGLVKPSGSGRHGTDAVLSLAGEADIPFELKSATQDGITTARDMGPGHLKKWRGKHWLTGFFDAKGTTLLRCLYASPEQMEPWISKMEAYIKPDFALAGLAARIPRELYEAILVQNFGDKEVYTLEEAKRLHKKQYSAAKYRQLMDLELPGQADSSSGKRNRKVVRGFSKARMLEIFAERWAYLTERGATLNNPHIRPAWYNDFKELPIGSPEEARRALRDAVRAVLVARKKVS